MRIFLASTLLAAIALTPACKTASQASDGLKSAGSSVADAVGGVTTSLVNVDLSNVLNDLALDLKIDKANIPINAQIPINIAANVCGVSINILSIGAGGGSSKGCTATNSSAELSQAVQQQLAANGSVGGGAQTNAPATTTQPATQPATQPLVSPPMTQPPASTTPTP
jgi:hypothetical protein